MAGCTICTSESRALIDGAMSAGSTPLDAFREYGEAAGLSLSAVYRHARTHRNRAIDLHFIGDTSSGDLVADLDNLRRSHLSQREGALSRGDSAAASREGNAALAASAQLLRIGVEDAAAASQLLLLDRIRRAVGNAIKTRPAVGNELANAARCVQDSDLATELDVMCQQATEFHESRNEHAYV